MELPVHHHYTLPVDYDDEGQGRKESPRATPRNAIQPVTSPLIQRKELDSQRRNDGFINYKSSPALHRKPLHQPFTMPTWAGGQHQVDFSNLTLQQKGEGHNAMAMVHDGQLQYVTSPISQRRGLQHYYDIPDPREELTKRTLSPVTPRKPLQQHYNQFTGIENQIQPERVLPITPHYRQSQRNASTNTEDQNNCQEISSEKYKKSVQTQFNVLDNTENQIKPVTSPQTAKKGVRVRFIQRPKAEGDSARIDQSNIHVYMIKHHEVADTISSGVKTTELLPERIPPHKENEEKKKEAHKSKKANKHVTFNDSLNRSKHYSNMEQLSHNRTMREDNPGEYWENRERNGRTLEEAENMLKNDKPRREDAENRLMKVDKASKQEAENIQLQKNKTSTAEKPKTVLSTAVPVATHVDPFRYSATNNNWMEQEAYYLCRMEEILGPWEGSAPPAVPTKLLPHMYIGSRKDLKDISHLKRLGITHILNCAGTLPFTVYDLSKDSDMKMYAQFHSLDNVSYPVMDHFEDSRVYIDRARREGGRVFVHCQMGINRSATICAAYIMVDENMDLLSAMKLMQKKRGLTIVNYNFRRQLVEFARNRGLLEKSSDLGNPGSRPGMFSGLQ